MAEESTTSTTAAAGTTNAAATTQQAAATTPVAGLEFQGMSLEQFNARLAKERETGAAHAIKSLGFDKADDAKARIAKAAEFEKAQLTDNEKRELQIKDLTTKASRVDEQDALIAQHAKVSFDGIKSEAMKKFVIAQAGDNPAARLKAITAATESGLFAELEKPAAAAAEVPAKLATSKAAGTPPVPGTGTVEKKPKDMTPAEYKAFLAKRNAGVRRENTDQQSSKK